MYQIFDSQRLWREIKGEDHHADAAITFGGSKRADRGDTDYLMDKLDKQVEDVIEGDE